jgi:predicted RND superfamily exporter protein
VAHARTSLDGMPVVRTLHAFDRRSGSWLERLIFEHRLGVALASALVTLALGWAAATRHAVNADYERMMPSSHPFVRAWRENASELRGLGDSLWVVVESARGDVWDPAYLEALRRITDDLVLAPGVDRAWVKSLWMPGVRWSEVTEEGFRGGPVMPDDFDGSAPAIEALRRNVARAGVAGTLVAADERSAAVFVPLLDRDPATGEGLDYRALAARVEALRAAHEAGGALRLHVVGFAILVGALIDGIRQVTAWFAVAAAIVSAAILLHTRCIRSTALVVGCSATAVVWQVGIVSALGLDLDPFSVLVPFLVFALGVSHGAQKMNGILQDVGRGTHRLVAARYTFRRLFAAGLTALLTDAVGFGVLALVDVPAIRQLALTATIGAGALVFTNLILLPVLLSYAGVSPVAAARSLRTGGAGARGAAWRFLERLTEPRRAGVTLAVAGALVLGALAVSRDLRIGDRGAGAPQLSPSSRYNRDVAFLAAHYGLTNDRFAVIVKTGAEGCLAWETLVEADRLAWSLRQLPAVHATASLPDAVRQITAGAFEGNPKWLTISRDQQVLNHAAQQAITRNPDLFNPDCSVMPVVAYLTDHRAETLDEVVGVADAFARTHSGAGRTFLLAAGTAGIEAATHRAVREARWTTTVAVYAAVLLLCLAALRSWRAALVTMIPLAATSVLCAALMVWLDIGITIATLPVIALGVGIPDYALYLLSVQLAHQRAGVPLAEAHRRALRFTGRVVALVGVTLAAGVVTWALSPIRLQADMGVLLTFMFLGNVAAALVLIPALSRFLLERVPPSRERLGAAATERP